MGCIFMNNSQEIANTVKALAKSKKITIGKMLSDCALSVNTLSSMQAGGYYPRLEAIAKIADYLGCSVDYLLGRTDNLLESPSKAPNSPQSAGAVALPSDAIKTAQEAAEAQGEETVQFIERAITTQAERDRVQRIINKQSKKGGEGRGYIKK